MMGVGKSAVGRELSTRTGWEFRDTDLMLQQKLGRPVSQLFQVYGESAFRDHETAVLRSLEPEECILSTGGGIILRDDNWTELRRLGVVMYLRADPSEILERLRSSKKRRPLLQFDDWEDRFRNLMTAREQYYRKADLIVELSGADIEAAAEKAYEAFLGADQ